MGAGNATGTLTFRADGSMQSALTVTVAETASFPASCYSQSECAQLQTQAAAGKGVTAAACTFNASSGCSCSITLSTDSSGTGTYAVNGSKITTSSPGEADEAGTYCVSGSSLSYQSTNEDGTSTVNATK